MSAAKPFDIPKKLVVAAFRAVKNSAGGAGIDNETIGQFKSKLKDNLYKTGAACPLGPTSRPACQGGRHSEEEWRGKDTRTSHGVGSRGSDGRQNGA